MVEMADGDVGESRKEFATMERRFDGPFVFLSTRQNPRRPRFLSPPWDIRLPIDSRTSTFYSLIHRPCSSAHNRNRGRVVFELGASVSSSLPLLATSPRLQSSQLIIRPFRSRCVPSVHRNDEEESFFRLIETREQPSRPPPLADFLLSEQQHPTY